MEPPYLNVLKVLTGKNFFYFTSDKSQIIELLEWCEENLGLLNPLSGASKVKRIKIQWETAKFMRISCFIGINRKEEDNKTVVPERLFLNIRPVRKKNQKPRL